MYKQSPSRNNRTKGSKAKLILQICLLLAVCFWLIYQVKRSHDKNVELDSEDEKVVGKVQSDAEILRFGKKDRPRITERDTDVDEHLEEEEKEAEEDEKKHEDDEQDIEDNRSEDNDDVEEEERFETEDHQNSTNENHGEDNDGDSTGTHEAREEQYKADDASSEVGHDNQTIMSETGNVTIEHTNETVTSNNEDEANRNITSTNVENVNTNVVESLISDDTSSLFRNMNGSDTMLVEGQKLESGTFDSEEDANVVPRDPIDASDSTLVEDEKDSRMDLDTLPEITSEVQNNDDTMAE